MLAKEKIFENNLESESPTPLLPNLFFTYSAGILDKGL